MILLVLTQFVFRLTFGVAVAMFLTSPRWVTSGFYRVHLWVLLGLNTFAALAVYATRSEYSGEARWGAALALAVAAAALSYAGSVLWLYEMRRAGAVVLAMVAAAGLPAAVFAAQWPQEGMLAMGLLSLDAATAGLLLGTALAAMLLGHWYLNTPSMRLEPLWRLLALLAAFLAARAVTAAAGLLLVATSGEGAMAWSFWAFIALRWTAGLAGVAILAWLTWLVLKIPNTQSATGMLYAAVILAFIGELTSQLLSADTAWPV